jgi:hypothetical protein
MKTSEEIASSVYDTLKFSLPEGVDEQEIIKRRHIAVIIFRLTGDDYEKIEKAYWEVSGLKQAEEVVSIVSSKLNQQASPIYIDSKAGTPFYLHIRRIRS